MTRFVNIGGTRVELSKTEAKEASRLLILEKDHRQRQFESWLNNTTPEALRRRIAVGKALRLKVPE